MKCRRLTWVNWIELVFGAIIPTWCFAIPLALMPIILMPSIVSGVSAGPSLALAGLGFWIVLFIIGLLALICLWLVILTGPEQIEQFSVLRWFVVVMMVLGLADAAYVLVLLLSGEVSRLTSGRPLKWGQLAQSVLTTVALVGPIVVSLRYLFGLLKKHSMFRL